MGLILSLWVQEYKKKKKLHPAALSNKGDSFISNYIKEVRDYTVRANEISLSPQLGVTTWRWQGMSHKKHTLPFQA